jgi:vanillate O-demethylase monooxygenase subunit
MFIKNCWYAAGFPEELGRSLLARTYLGEPVVLYRKRDGKPVALEDRCAHRRLPLSMGRLIDDTLQCGYHGLIYDCAGACVAIPGQPRISPGTGVRAYPVVDRHAFTRIWMGDPAFADESLIPDYGGLDRPDWASSRIQFQVRAHYQLIIDNLLDLSHLAYVHATTTGIPEIAEDAGEQFLDTHILRRPGTVGFPSRLHL